MYSSTAKIGQGCIGKDQRLIMVEITASDIYWIGAMDKISLGLFFSSMSLRSINHLCHPDLLRSHGFIRSPSWHSLYHRLHIYSKFSDYGSNEGPSGNRQQSANTGDLREHCETNRTVSERESGNIEKQR